MVFFTIAATELVTAGVLSEQTLLIDMFTASNDGSKAEIISPILD